MCLSLGAGGTVFSGLLAQWAQRWWGGDAGVRKLPVGAELVDRLNLAYLAMQQE